jgi:hypothetical protein
LKEYPFTWRVTCVMGVPASMRLSAQGAAMLDSITEARVGRMETCTDKRSQVKERGAGKMYSLTMSHNSGQLRLLPAHKAHRMRGAASEPGGVGCAGGAHESSVREVQLEDLAEVGGQPGQQGEVAPVPGKVDIPGEPAKLTSFGADSHRLALTLSMP